MKQLAFFAVKRRIESDITWSKVIGLHVAARFCRTMDAVHPNILPFDGERAAVPDIVQCNDNFLESNIAMADRSKIPLGGFAFQGFYERGRFAQSALLPTRP
jgi:hypothetical protein